jgi:hypothetical protein
VAVALLVDAAIVRSVVIPKRCDCLASATDYLSRWLEWLPAVAIEDASVARHDEAAAAPR